MKHKLNTRTGFIFLVIVVLGIGLLWAACTDRAETGGGGDVSDLEESAEREILYYTCGMHPSVKVSAEDFEAGKNKCPICNMDLVPVYQEGEGLAGQEYGDSEMAPPEIKLSPRAQALAQVKTESVAFLPLTKEIDTVGELVWDERRMAYVAARVSGRLEELYVNYTGAGVRENAPLASIYSPQLLTTQEEFLLALETRDHLQKGPDAGALQNAEALVRAARTRLALWGILESQIQALEASRTASTHMILHAPIGGTVIHKNAFEGRYVKEGDDLFQIADLSLLWMEAQVYEHDLAHVRVGQEVHITTHAFPGEMFHGRVAFIEPQVDPRTRSVKARVDVPNSGRRLKPGMYVEAFISVRVEDGIAAPEKDMWICPMCPEVLEEEPGECPECGMDLVKKPAAAKGSVLAVPRGAVLDTGERTLVYVEHEEGSYMPHEVVLGSEATAEIDGVKRRFFAVKSGLAEGMRVVTRANFLIDSQSQITGQAEATYSGALERGETEEPPSKHIH